LGEKVGNSTNGGGFCPGLSQGIPEIFVTFSQILILYDFSRSGNNEGIVIPTE